MDAVVAVLAQARDYVERGWTTHTDARDATGAPVKPWGKDAAAWSLLGALVAAVEQHADAAGEGAALTSLATACLTLAKILEVDSLEEWNDDPRRTKAEVVDALQRAIKSSGAKPAPLRFSAN